MPYEFCEENGGRELEDNDIASSIAKRYNQAVILLAGERLSEARKGRVLDESGTFDQRRGLPGFERYDAGSREVSLRNL